MHDILLRNPMKRVRSLELFHFLFTAETKMCPCRKFRALILRYINSENSSWQRCEISFPNKHQKTYRSTVISSTERSQVSPGKVNQRSQHVHGLHEIISKENRFNEVTTCFVCHWYIEKNTNKSPVDSVSTTRSFARIKSLLLSHSQNTKVKSKTVYESRVTLLPRLRCLWAAIISQQVNLSHLLEG